MDRGYLGLRQFLGLAFAPAGASFASSRSTHRDAPHEAPRHFASLPRASAGEKGTFMPSRLRSAVTGLLLSTVCLLAHPLTFTVDLLPDANVAGRYTANVQSVHDLSGSVADTFDFVAPVDGSLSFELQAFGPAGSGGFFFQGYQVDGGPIVFNNGSAASLSAAAIPIASGPGSLLVGGVVAPALPARVSVTAGYTGSITVTAIPEPQTWLLMIAGLTVLGRAVARQHIGARRNRR
jgi:hypothetical protein